MRVRKRRNWVKIGEKEREIIKFIGIGTLVITSLALPNLPIALQTIAKIRGNKGLQQFLEKLEKKNVIYLSDEKICLTKNGKKLLQQIQISDIEISKPGKWDEIWWLVSYDIPKAFNHERDLFRSALKRLGFYQVQASLWVFPYKCKEEIAIMANDLDINSFVIVMATDNLPKQKEMEEHYNL